MVTLRTCIRFSKSHRFCLGWLAYASLVACGGSGAPHQQGAPEVMSATVEVSEGDVGSVVTTVDLHLTRPADSLASFDYESVDGTAGSPEDFSTFAGTATFPAGASATSIEFDLVGDLLYEGEESFSIQLSNPSGNIALPNTTISVAVLDNDNPPLLTLLDTSVVEGDSGETRAEFAVLLSRGSGLPAKVDYETSELTAEQGVDYAEVSGTLTIPAGSPGAGVTVVVSGDLEPELDESFALVLSNPVDATLADLEATGSILNDDPFATGLDARPENLTCVAPALQVTAATVSVVEAYPGLPSLDQPTELLLEPVPQPRWFVLGKSGVIKTFDPLNPTALSTWLDLTASVSSSAEGGLLGMAFHPDYPRVPEVFLSYTRNQGLSAMRLRVSRFTLDNVRKPRAGVVEQVVIEVDQPNGIHVGGDIGFGDERLLYIGLGDGGMSDAQDTRRLAGSFLRIDVLDPLVSFPSTPYLIPHGNPHSENPVCGPGDNAQACPEIFAWGFRNPRKWSFDPVTGDLWTGDAGPDGREEIDLVEPGGNYGWNCQVRAVRPDLMSACEPGIIPPLSQYAHTGGNSAVIGGRVYRGSEIRNLAGQYVYADSGSGRIFSLRSAGDGGYAIDTLVETGAAISALAVDQAGELYASSHRDGRLLRLVAQGSSPRVIADVLSKSGCVDPDEITRPYAGLVPYDLNVPFWSDGAGKVRFMGLPSGTTIAIDAGDDWEFPDGTVLVKNFRLNDRLIETRHLMRHPGGTWHGYTYEWNEAQTEATRVEGGKTVEVEGQTWTYPSEAQCLRCHTAAAGVSLGPETAQLNGGFRYPDSGRLANQLSTLDHIRMFDTPLPADPGVLPALPVAGNVDTPLNERARAYLHSNCSQCHRPGGRTPVAMDFRYSTSLSDTNACDVAPERGDLGIAEARIISPGNPERSVLIARDNRRDSAGMPPVGSALVDEEGVILLSEWIQDLSGCN